MNTAEHSSINPKIPLIIQCALAILKEKGDTGLTMRQVALKAGMSLSNVQFYFKNKNALLKGMVEYYFERCVQLIDTGLVATTKEVAPEQRVRDIVHFCLDREGEMAETCEVFRHLWAISARNEEINGYLEKYYEEYSDILMSLVLPLTDSPEKAQKAVALLLPYSEGYVVAIPKLTFTTEQIVELLTTCMINILDISSSESV